MTNIKLNPLNLPEIISPIAGFLDREDLLNCILISKAFYSACIGSIWRKIVVKDFKSPSCLTGEILQKHREYIEEIVFQSTFPEVYTTLRGCGRLQSISFGPEYNQLAQPTIPKHLPDFIKAHSTITKLSFKNVTSSHVLWGILLDCTNLNRLELFDILGEVEADLFFQVYKKLGHLVLDNVSLGQLPTKFLNNEGSEYTFPKMLTLSINDFTIRPRVHPYTPSYCLGTLLRSCPGLCALKFSEPVERDSFRGLMPFKTSRHYIEAFLQHPWTLYSLSELFFPNLTIIDEDMAALLRQMTDLRRLNILGCDFSQLSLQELLADRQKVLDDGHMVWRTRSRRLCETIEILKFDVQGIGMKGIVQAVLSNCPRLKQLRGPRITVTEIIDGAEWVCTGLTYLIIYLEADVDQRTEEGMAKARIAFRQLGKLTQLGYLDVREWGLWETIKRTLDFKLRAGLDELASLKSLHRLVFRDDSFQNMQLEDATWMVNNWPNLRKLDCPLIDDPAVASLFASRGIICYREKPDLMWMR